MESLYGGQFTLYLKIISHCFATISEDRVTQSNDNDTKARVKRRTSHEPNPIQPIRLM